MIKIFNNSTEMYKGQRIHWLNELYLSLGRIWEMLQSMLIEGYEDSSEIKALQQQVLIFYRICLDYLGVP